MTALWDRLIKDRYRVVRGYRLDRWLFQLMMFATFGFLYYLAASNHFSLDYYSCDPGFGGHCHNPFYKGEDWKCSETLPGGEYGTKPGFLMNNASLIVAALFIITFVINHLVHNNGFDFPKLEVEE
jgi:hypothetical protein